jgi:hypothetical protein
VTSNISSLDLENAPRVDVFSHNLKSQSDMKTLAVISILALLTISGAAYTDLVLTGGRQSTQSTN